MKLLIGHLVDSRTLESAFSYIRDSVNDGNEHIFALCGDPDLEDSVIPKEWITDKSTAFVCRSKFISDWVARIVKEAVNHEFDFLQIRDWDDTYGFQIPDNITEDVQLICPNYSVHYNDSGKYVTQSPYGVFKEVETVEIDPQLEPISIHRQFKFFGKKLVQNLCDIMWNDGFLRYPELCTLDDTMLMPLAAIECYRNRYIIARGMPSSMTFEVRPSSDTHKDSLAIRHTKYLDTTSKVLTFLKNHYKTELEKDLYLCEFIYKFMIDRCSKYLFSISYHKRNG